MRYSKQREIIYEVLAGTKTHPDAEWVYGEVRRRMPDVSLGTVYRNLKQLAESGTIATVETADKAVHYDADISAHMHFVCSKCGTIQDLFMESGMVPKLNGLGYEVSREKAVYYGICDCCLKK